MNMSRREAAKARLHQLLSGNVLTQDMYVRTWSDHLIIGGHEPFGPDGESRADDQLRLTALNTSTNGLSVRRHTGRWEKTPFTGTLDELVDIIWTLMQRIVAPYS
jgi:hypothetical protein